MGKRQNNQPLNRKAIEEINLTTRIQNEIRRDIEYRCTESYPEVTPSPETMKKAQRLFRRIPSEKEKARRRVAVRTCAAGFVVLVLAFSICFSTISAFREATIGFFLSLSGQNTVVNNPNDINVNWEQFCHPSYLPDGFILIDAGGSNQNISEQEAIYVTLQKDNAVFTIVRQNAKVQGEYDAENLDTSEEIPIGDVVGHYTEKEGVRSIYWVLGDYLFSVSGNLEREEIVKVAEGIQLP